MSHVGLLGPIAKYPGPGDVHDRCLFSPRAGGWEANTKARAGFVSLRPPPGLRGGRLLAVSNRLSPLCVRPWHPRVCPDLFLQGHWSDWIRTHAKGLVLTRSPL